MKPTVDTAYLHFDETGSIPAIKHARSRKIGWRFASWAARSARAHIASMVMGHARQPGEVPWRSIA